MDDGANYHKEKHAAILQGKPITVTHLTPILSPTKKEKRKQEIENQLFDVFSKYQSIHKK